MRLAASQGNRCGSSKLDFASLALSQMHHTPANPVKCQYNHLRCARQTSFCFRLSNVHRTLGTCSLPLFKAHSHSFKSSPTSTLTTLIVAIRTLISHNQNRQHVHQGHHRRFLRQHCRCAAPRPGRRARWQPHHPSFERGTHHKQTVNTGIR